MATAGGKHPGSSRSAAIGSQDFPISPPLACLASLDSAAPGKDAIFRGGGRSGIMRARFAARTTGKPAALERETQAMETKRLGTGLALALAMMASPAGAADKISVSVWGGAWRDMIADTMGKKFTAETGAEVE